MEAIIHYQDGVKFEVEAGGHKIICDQPASNHGTDAGMTPPELLLASLGTCAGYYAVQYLKARNLPTAGLQVKVSAEKALQPARLAKFQIDVEAPELPEERHREGLLRAVKGCLIHHTLVQAPEIEIQILVPVNTAS
ncbi:MAG: OsmC family protein [Acidobacteria bacterium]|nr:OsmC family protein [Acidobacteriota bacterium]